jgi:glycosyltransferase involved in cell wall biosynthesis
MRQPEARIAAAICTYDRYDLLPKAVESAVRQTLPAESYRILVIDNSPDHDRAHRFSKEFETVPNLTYIVEETPGLSNARNVAVRVCDTDFIAFMDDDAVASAQWLAEILDAFAGFGSSAMVVGGRVEPIWGGPRPPWLHDSLLANLSVVDYGEEVRPIERSEWFAGTNIAFRTSAVLDNGGFATNLGRIGSGATLLSNEEIQLLDLIRAGGGRLIYTPRAVISHLVHPSRLNRSWFRKRSAWQAVSDFTMNPERMVTAASDHWKGAIGYFNNLPPHLRTIRGLIHDTDDPELFRWQLGAIYLLTAGILAGFEGVSLE